MTPFSTKGSEMNLREKITEIEHEIVDLTVPLTLKSIDAFKLIQFEAKEFNIQYFEYLKDPKISLQRKMILVYALQSMPFDEYKKLLKVISDGYCDNKIEEHIAKLIIFPGFDWNTSVLENYKDKEIIRLLQNMTKKESASKPFLKVISHILNGDSSRDAKKYNRRKKAGLY